MRHEDRPQDGRKQFEAVMDALNERDFKLRTGFLDQRAWAERVDAVWADWHQEVVDFREVGDSQAVAVLRTTGRARGSGVPLDTRTGNVLTWRGTARCGGTRRTPIRARPSKPWSYGSS
jgi:ketosteroid isomerase-like protein